MVETTERAKIRGSYNHHICQFPEEINEINFFRFDKQLIREKQWAELPLASKSIFPAICSHCNSQGHCHPGQQRIAILSGCTEKTVRTGLKGLRRLEGFHMTSQVSARGHNNYRYIIDFPKQEKGKMFPFYKSIIEAGNWSLLTPSAQALYPVMRQFGFWENELNDKFNIHEYIERGYDYVDADIDILSDYAGIHESTLYKALHLLEDNNFIEDIGITEGRKTWKVFLKPDRRFEANYLNHEVSQKYNH